MSNSQVVKNKRTVWVWVISIFYFFSAGYTLLSFYLIHSGFVSLPEETRLYLEGLSVFDYIFTILIGLMNLSGAVTLFLLRKIAYPLFLISFISNILMSIIHMLTRDLLSAFVSGGAIGMFIGWGIILAACLYSRHLSKSGVLQ